MGKTLTSKNQSNKNLVVTSNRRGWIDYARGIAIIMVVFGHVSGGFISSGLKINLFFHTLIQVIYYARMPLFFVISGIYIWNSYEKRGLKKFIEYKFSTILYPYFIWGGLQLGFQMVASYYNLSNTPRKITDFLFLLYKPHEIDQFWFLYVLFGVAALFALLRSYCNISKIQFLILGSLTYILFYYLPPTFYDFGIKTICKFLFYLALGDVISSYVLNPKNFEKLSSIKYLIIFALLYASIKTAMIRENIPEMETDFFSWQNALLLVSIFTGLGLILNVSFILERYQLFLWLRKIGKYSLYIYIMHNIVSGFSRIVLMKITNGQYTNLILYVVTGLAIGLPIAIYKMTNYFGLSFLYTPKKTNIKTFG